MSSFYQLVISIISKPSEKRKDDEIHMILSWFINLFKKKSAVFGDIQAEVVKDIIKNCSFETKKQDEIIIRQGDVGDCFYINLRGKVSIYINHKKHDEMDMNDDNTSINNSFSLDPHVENDSISIGDDSLNNSISANYNQASKSKKLRERLGNYVTSLGAGEGFGEIALVSDDNRTASIIADEITDLMVVNKALYARCLQAPTLRKLAEKREFINKSPFFGNWAPKMKKLLSLCLERDIIPYDSYLGRQGEPADKMFFIINGQAKVTVNPSTHQSQYPKLYPLKLPENEDQDIITSWIEEKNQLLTKAKILKQTTKTKSKSSQKQSNKNLANIGIKRRNETFAEAEHRLKTKNIEVGILGGGEITGMCEIIFDMPSYMQSTKCLEDCDVFYIFKRSYERLISKRNSFCINKMKENVYMKLIARNNRLKSTNPIDLYRSIQYRIELSNRKNSSSDTSPISSSSLLKRNQLKGPLVKLDLRPKSTTYLQIKKRNAQNNNNTNNDSLNQTQNELIVDQKEDLNLSLDEELNRNKQIDQQMLENEKDLNESDNLNDLALEDLESRMKKWHLDLGCRKAFVPKLNRIDVDKIRKDIRVGGNIFIRRKGLHSKNNMYSNNKGRIGINRSRSNSDAYSNSSSENTSTEAENETIFTKYNTNGNNNTTIVNFLRNGSTFSTETKFFNALSQKLQPYNNNSNNTDNSAVDLNPNLINNFMNFVDPESVSTLNIYQQQNQSQQHHMISIDESNKIIDEMSLVPQANSNGCVLFAPSYLTFTPKNKSYTCRKSSIHSVTNLDLNGPSEFNESKLANNNDTSLISEQSKLNESVKLNNIQTNPNETTNMENNSGQSTNSINSANLSREKMRKKSMPNMVFSRKDSGQLAPYVVRRKFSVGQIKIQHTGKQYSKEEYIALKDELKKQTRRYSISSAHS